MKKCPECQNIVGTNISTCPKCGYPLDKINIESSATGIICLVIGLLYFFINIKYININSLLFLILPVFIIVNILKEKQIINNKIPIYIINTMTILYFSYQSINIISNLNLVLRLFLTESISYIALLIEMLTYLLYYLITIIMIIALFNHKKINIIKDNINLIYYINIGIIIVSFLSVILQAIEYKLPEMIITISLHTSFNILLSTYLKQILKKEV